MKIVLFTLSVFLSFFLFEKEVDSNFSYKNQSFVTDTIPPILNLPDTVIFYTTSTDCQKVLSIIPKIEDETPFDSLTIQWALDLDHDERINKEGLGILNEIFNVGNNWVKFSVTDAAGNSSEIEFIVQLLEADPRPTAVCYNGGVWTSLSRFQNCEGFLFASDCDASSFSCISPFTYGINRVFDQNNNGIIDSTELETTPPLSDSIVFYSDDVTTNKVHHVQMWVIDTTGAFDYCLTTISVEADCYCDPSCDPLRLQGCIQNELGDTLENNTVLISDGLYQETQSAGCFYFIATSNISDVSVVPKNDSFSANGISTFDIAAITKHILNTELLDSPYKMIAADANNSKSITLLDILAIRKVILRIENSFPNNSPWRFVPESFEFPNPENPWETSFPERIEHNNLVSNLNFDFIGIQVGNVN